MARVTWVITVVDRTVSWRQATAAALVRDAGLPLDVAKRWGEVRRGMSPKGLARKAREQRN